jgi:hypothetical protein
MNAAINVLVMMTLFFTGMAQSGSMPSKVGYGIAICSAVLAMVLAMARYKGRKARGE